MGYSGLARWVNANPKNLEDVNNSVLRNHGGQFLGKWTIQIHSYRSSLPHLPERYMWTLTMGENVFVLLEDPSAPLRAEVPGIIAGGPGGPSHFRTTFICLKQSGSLDQLLNQMKAQWAPVRQSMATGAGAAKATGISIEGSIWAIGTDWRVRAGMVMQSGTIPKGMILEAEYLPLPSLTSAADGTSELLSNLLISILPNIPDARTNAITVPDAQWKEVDEYSDDPISDAKVGVDGSTDARDDSFEDVYASGLDKLPKPRNDDWVGMERDRRSAYIILAALKSEGIL